MKKNNIADEKIGYIAALLLILSISTIVYIAYKNIIKQQIKNNLIELLIDNNCVQVTYFGTKNSLEFPKDFRVNPGLSENIDVYFCQGGITIWSK